MKLYAVKFTCVMWIVIHFLKLLSSKIQSMIKIIANMSAQCTYLTTDLFICQLSLLTELMHTKYRKSFIWKGYNILDIYILDGYTISREYQEPAAGHKQAWIVLPCILISWSPSMPYFSIFLHKIHTTVFDYFLLSTNW